MVIFVSGLVAFLTFAIPFLDGSIWTWSDEVWNWTELARKGPQVSATYYPAANNHVFLTVLQSLWPHAWIVEWPPLLRVWGIVLQVLIISLAALRLDRRYRRNARFLFAGLVFLGLVCIPWMLDWTFYARGYPVASALLLLFVVEAVRDRPAVGILVAAMVLCVYTLPTMAVPAAFCGSLLFLLRIVERRHATVVTLLLAGILSGVALLLLYGPILEQMAEAARKLGVQVEEENPPLFGQFAGFLQNPLYLSIFALILLIPVLDGIQNRRWSSATMVAAGIMSILAFDFLADRGISGRPFLRNAHFLLPLLMAAAALSLASLSARSSALAAALALLLYLLAGSGLIQNTVPHWQSLQQSSSPVRALRELLEAKKMEGALECAWFSEPSCQLISIQYELEYKRMDVPESGPCADRIDALTFERVGGRKIWLCGQ